MGGRECVVKLLTEAGKSFCYFELPFDPKEVFGKVRAPVKVTINGFSFRTTVAHMGEGPFIGLNRANRAGAGVAGGERVRVRLELDTEPRVVVPPADLARALRANAAARAAWAKLSYTHRREHVEAIEEAKRPETRARRIAGAVKQLAGGRG